MATTDQLEIVKQLVLQERKIVTYGWLSRHLNIHVNKAKRLLCDFIAKYRSSSENGVHAIYCICGLTTNNNQHTVTLVTQEKLEAARKGFTHFTGLHVYSVQPECPTEAELIKADRGPTESAVLPSNTNKDASSTLVSQSINVKKESLNLPEKADEKKPIKSKSTSDESTPITEEIKNTKEKQQIGDKTSDIASLLKSAASRDESKTSNKKKKRKSDEVEINHENFEISKEQQTTKKSKKQDISKQKSDKASDIVSLLNKSVSQNESKTSNKKEKKKKRKSDEGEDFETSKEEQATKKSKTQDTSKRKSDNASDIASLFNKVRIASQDESETSNKKLKKNHELDVVEASGEEEEQKSDEGSLSQNKVTMRDKVAKKEENENDDLDQQEVEVSKIRQISNERIDDTEQQDEADDFMEINDDKKDQSQDELSATSVRSDALPMVQQKKRGRRQVSKSKSYVNERGYTVHENYHEWESFSEDESVSEPPAKKPQRAIKLEPNVTAKRGKKKKVDNGSQKSLLSFFGKK